MLRRFARWVGRLARLLALTGLLAGVPYGLTTQIGWPLPRSLPTGIEDVQGWLTTPLTDQTVINLLAIALWILWASFTASAAAEVAGALRGVTVPRLGATAPMQNLAAWLLSGLTAGVLATAGLSPAASMPPTGPAPTLQQNVATPTATNSPTLTASALTVSGAAESDAASRPDRLAADGTQHRLVHEVARGDWMWHIANRYLGDPRRYPEIAELNRNLAARYDRFPDHIEPGDQLLLPDDASDRGTRHHATGTAHLATTDPEPPKPLDPAPPGSPDAAPTTPGPPGDEPTNPPSDPSRPTPSVTVQEPDAVVPSPGTSTPHPATATPEATTTAPPPADHLGPDRDVGDLGEQPDSDGADGVNLGAGSWIPWTVAVAVAAAMAVVWRQRRCRYIPRRLDDPEAAGEAELDVSPQPEKVGEPAAVARIRRALRLRAHTGEPDPPLDDEPAPDLVSAPLDEPETPPSPTHSAASPATGPAQQAPESPQLPEGGIGLVGPGAEAAARGALVAALSTGAPDDPDAQTEVVIPADTIVTLLGADAVNLGSWRRLRVTPSLDNALAVVETRLLGTARLLDEYEVEDLPALRDTAPAERPVPPLLLIAPVPGAEARMRTRNALGIGRGQGVSAFLLGQWSNGATVYVESDGTCGPAEPQTELGTGVPARMAVIEQAPAFELLRTLREAHTGHPSPPADDDASVGEPSPPTGQSGTGTRVPNEKKAPVGRDDAHQDTTDSTEAVDTGTTGDAEADEGIAVPRAVARVLGVPEIANWQAAGRPLRKAAVALLVYLAVHPDGVTPDQIQEDLWPDSRRRLAATKLHTAASNLRHLLAAAAGADDDRAGDYVRKDRGRYRILPEAVEIDLWTLRRECTRARHATTADERIEALRRACDAYRGELAAGVDYDWVTGHREAARRLGLDAHTTLADLVAEADPGEAARLLLRAVDIDPMAEHVYRQAMRACRRIGDAETIRTLLRQLAGQLDSVGAEPTDETTELADQLRADLHQRTGIADDS